MKRSGIRILQEILVEGVHQNLILQVNRASFSVQFLGSWNQKPFPVLFFIEKGWQNDPACRS